MCIRSERSARVTAVPIASARARMATMMPCSAPPLGGRPPDAVRSESVPANRTPALELHRVRPAMHDFLLPFSLGSVDCALPLPGVGVLFGPSPKGCHCRTHTRDHGSVLGWHIVVTGHEDGVVV